MKYQLNGKYSSNADANSVIFKQLHISQVSNSLRLLCWLQNDRSTKDSFVAELIVVEGNMVMLKDKWEQLEFSIAMAFVIIMLVVSCWMLRPYWNGCMSNI